MKVLRKKQGEAVVQRATESAERIFGETEKKEEKSMDTRLINDYQKEQYDSSLDYNEKELLIYSDVLQIASHKNSLCILDIGGGNGRFAQLVAEYFSDKTVEVYVLDNAEYESSVLCPSVKFINASAFNITDIFRCNSIDIVFFNGVLHHLVFDSWRETQRRLDEILQKVSIVLKNDGYLCVREERAESYIIYGIAGFIIYKLISCRIKWVVMICKRLDGKSAGVGVRFLSDKLWRERFENNGFCILHIDPGDKRVLKWYMRVFLLLKEYYFRVHYIMQKHSTL